MRRTTLAALIIGVVVVLSLAPAGAQYYGGAPSVAHAQEGPPEAEKGVKARNLVTSLGGFRGTATVPIVFTGQIVEIEPGGQTGRQRHNVPSYIFVIEGTLVTNSFGGPIGTGGVQYHAAGQSYMDVPGIWHNHSNGGQAPVKYLLLLVSTPGAATTEKAKADD